MRTLTTRRLAAIATITVVAVLAIAGFGASAWAAVSAPRLYDTITETSMPHLDENLRYAVRREQRCLDPQDLSSAFWMLGHVSLQDCKLVKQSQREDTADYALHCDGGHGTTGKAAWKLAPDRLAGQLDVKLGGKNMTFYQRIVATPVGECAAAK